MQHVTIMGNVGKDPERKTLPSGKVLLNFSLAVSSKKDETCWYEINIWEDKIQFFEKMLSYIKKGSRLIVTGFFSCEAYLGKDGEAKVRRNVNPFCMEFAGGGKKEEEQPQQAQSDFPF